MYEAPMTPRLSRLLAEARREEIERLERETKVALPPADFTTELAVFGLRAWFQCWSMSIKIGMLWV